MKTRLPYRLVATGVLGFVLYSCTTETPSAPLDDPEIAAAPRTGCDLIQSISSDTRNFFPMPERKTATDAVSAMSSACRDGLTAQVNALAWDVLSQVEALMNAARGGSPSVGSNLVNGLIACTKGLCLSADLESPLIDFQPALSPYGLFGVRTGTGGPVPARGAIPVGTTNAQWVVEADDWSQVMTGIEDLIIYGAPRATTKPLKEINMADLQFDLEVWPDGGPFEDGSLHVGTCFTGEGIEVPHQPGPNNPAHMAPRMQRESVLLEVPGRRFSCEPPPIQQASLGSGLARLIRNVMPDAFRLVRFSDLKVTVIGGSPLDFSTFAVVGADPNGYLTMHQGPNSVVVKDQPIGDIRVGAYSGAGTPAEKVSIRLTVYNNSGVPAGAVITMPDVAYFTSEEDGTVTISGATIGKAGGYTICAEGTLNGFTFTAACSQLFHVRNQ